MAESDPYVVLGVQADADAETIAAAYRALARRFHPDVSPDPDAQDHMARINGAFSILRDPIRRAQWDEVHIPPALRAAQMEADARQAAQQAFSRQAAARPGEGGQANGGEGTAPGRGAAGWSGNGTGTTGAAAAGHRNGFPGVASDQHVAWRLGPHGEGAAGPPPGPRQGTVLPFGRHIGWSIGEIARADPGYLVWLKDRREGEPYRAEIERLLNLMFPTLLTSRQGLRATPPARRGRLG